MTDRDTQSDPEALLPIGEAARLLGVSVETVRRWDRLGQIASIRTIGGQRRFRRSEINSLTEARSA